MSEKGLTKNSTKETQHQTPSYLSFDAPRSFVLNFSQIAAQGPTLHTLHDQLYCAFFSMIL